MKNIICLVAIILLLIGIPTASAQQAAPGKNLQIVDVKLGKAVQDKQIAGESATFAVNDKVYLWMKTTGGAGDSLTVTWKQESFTYTTRLAIGGTPWRTWTYKTASRAGAWTVAVTDAAGAVLKELNFTVEKAK